MTHIERIAQALGQHLLEVLRLQTENEQLKGELAKRLPATEHSADESRAVVSQRSE